MTRGYVALAVVAGWLVYRLTCSLLPVVDLEAPVPTAIEWASCTARCSAAGGMAYNLTYSLAGWRCECRNAWAQEDA